MLVLSRRPNEKVLFPSINTAVQVVSIKGGTVRLGIEAPPEVTILRAELQDRTAERGATTRLPEPAGSRLRGLRHLLRNRLNITTVGLGLLREQARAGLSDEMERTIAKIEEEMQRLQQRLESEAAQTPSQPPKPARKTRKALLVEDEENERELLAGYLRWQVSPWTRRATAATRSTTCAPGSGPTWCCWTWACPAVTVRPLPAKSGATRLAPG